MSSSASFSLNSGEIINSGYYRSTLIPLVSFFSPPSFLPFIFFLHHFCLSYVLFFYIYSILPQDKITTLHFFFFYLVSFFLFLPFSFLLASSILLEDIIDVHFCLFYAFSSIFSFFFPSLAFFSIPFFLSFPITLSVFLTFPYFLMCHNVKVRFPPLLFFVFCLFW